ncbi:hypothetical protein ACLKA6_015069 [Drosophila palustris]
MLLQQIWSSTAHMINNLMDAWNMDSGLGIVSSNLDRCACCCSAAHFWNTPTTPSTNPVVVSYLCPTSRLCRVVDLIRSVGVRPRKKRLLKSRIMLRTGNSPNA